MYFHRQEEKLDKVQRKHPLTTKPQSKSHVVNINVTSFKATATIALMMTVTSSLTEMLFLTQCKDDLI